MVKKRLMAAGWLTVMVILAATGRVEQLGAGEEPIPIAELKRDSSVDFEKEVLPILRRNCLACHNSTKKEGGLVLETPQTILKGGSSGPAVVPGKPLESNLLLQASRRQESYMPPPKNDVGARPLTSEELGLIQLWIAQGAVGTVGKASESIAWQPLPPGLNAIYAISMTADGLFVAAARANQVFIYHVPSGREVGRLTDPKLLEMGLYNRPGVADLDMIQSLAFSTDGQFLVTGGYRTAKLWKREQQVRLAEFPKAESSVTALAVAPDGRWIVRGELSGRLQILDASTHQLLASANDGMARVTAVSIAPDSSQCVSVGEDKTLRVWNRDGSAAGAVTAPAVLRDVVWLNSGWIVAAGEDHQIYAWQAARVVTQAGGADAPTPRTLSGHSQAVTCLARLSDTQVLSGSADGTLRVWDVGEGNAIRQINHGQPVVDVAVSGDGQLWASASIEGKNIKVWNAADGAMVRELRGDHRTIWNAEVAARAAALAQRLVEVATADVNQAKERVKSEEANLKQVDEERKKAAEELAKKTEAAKEPVAKKEAAEKELAAVRAAITQAEEQKPKAAEALAATQKAEQEAQTRANAANDALAAAVKAVEGATAELQSAKKALDEQPDNADLQAAVKAAEEKLAKAEQAKKEAEQAKASADEALAQARKAAGQAAEELKKIEESLAAAQKQLKPAEEKLAQLTPAAQKALDEQTAAQRALESAERAAQRAQEALERAKQEIGPLEETVQAKQKAQQEAAAAAGAAKQLADQSALLPLALTFTPDHQTLAAACQDGTVRLFDARSGAPWNLIEQPDSQVLCLAASETIGLLTGGTDGNLISWQWTPTWTWQRTFGDPNDPSVFVDRVTAVAVDPQGCCLATATGEPSRTGEILIWDVASGELKVRIQDAHTDEVFSLKFSGDGRFLASSSADRMAKIFEVASGKFVRAFEGHTHHVLGVAWSADGRQLVTAGADKVLKVWNTVTGDQLRTIQGFGKEVTAVHYVGDSEQVVATCGDASVQIKNASNGGNVRNLSGASDFVYALAVSADGRLIAAGGLDGIVRVWQSDGKLLVAFPPP